MMINEVKDERGLVMYQESRVQDYMRLAVFDRGENSIIECIMYPQSTKTCIMYPQSTKTWVHGGSYAEKIRASP